MHPVPVVHPYRRADEYRIIKHLMTTQAMLWLMLACFGKRVRCGGGGGGGGVVVDRVASAGDSDLILVLSGAKHRNP